MWPKLLMQLVEFLPHATRLLPVADRYLATNGATEKAMVAMGGSIAAMDGRMEALAAGVEGSLAQVAKTHIDVAARLDTFAGEHLALAGRLDSVTEQISEAAAEAKRGRRAAELAQTRVDTLEKQLTSLRTLLLAGLAVLAVLIVVILVVLLRGRAGLVG